MLVIGLTGGIGSGKSTAAGRLAEHGAVVIDADRVAREVVEPGTPGLAEVVNAFGADVLADDGSLDRARLGSLVFADAAARQRLNAIVHPLVGRRTAELMAAAPANSVVVHDVPLLVENGLAPAYHLVVIVEAARSARVARLVRDRGMAESDVLARLETQASDEQRRAVADIVLGNDGTPAELRARIDTLWRARIEPYADNLRRGRRAQRAEAVLVPYQPDWPRQFDRLAGRLHHVAGPLRVDHVGSTAVPGLAAKDVIDIQLSVESMEQADQLRAALETAGFPPAPHIRADHPLPVGADPAPWAKRFHGSADPGRPAHLHLRVTGSPGWRYALLFRDWLRAVPAEAAVYEAEKRRLATEHPARENYAAAKEPWFAAVLPRAEHWAEQAGWRP